VRQYIICLVLLFLAVVAAASPITVTGKVVGSHGRPVTDAIITASRRPLNESNELKGMLAMFPLDTTGTNAKGEFALRTDTRSHFLEVSSDRLHAHRLLSHFSTSGNVITLK
jgi:hypothetical protein